MEAKRKFKDLPAGGKIAVIVTVIAQLTLMVAALRDLYKRPAEQVKGPKPAWAAASLISFFGPIAYFAFGRRK
ncbi:phospholipase D-like protein [Glutamicibacter mysorens]|uniref:Phospholipase D-like protein n=1 Tax=Glutamicibacter mysorens TaxID=257984 RepID=A0ABX4N2D2_9MICC|nr:PLD nuclease N-terminal domain-containing protein [Glutamicibacter mysorens]PJJ44646.1 phospholipase D-like protein [Glutamicibacter mysorens]